MLNYSDSFSSFAVKDTKTAKEFYGNSLGLKVTNVEGMGDLLELTLSGDKKIMIYPKSDFVPATYTVLNFLVENLEKTVDELMQKGVQFEKYDMPEIKTDAKDIARGNGGPTIAWFKDPAGNILALIENKK